MPALILYQLRDGPHGREPTTERGDIERLARESWLDDRRECLDWIVIESRFNVVRSSVPGVVTTSRKLRDYLPPDDPGGPPKQAERSLQASLP